METEPKLELDRGCSEYADRYQEMKLFKEKKYGGSMGKKLKSKAKMMKPTSASPSFASKI